MLRSIVIAAAAVAATGSAALAADLSIPSTPAPIVESAGVGFEGLYAGVQLGGYFAEDSDTQAVLGGVIGYNFTADSLLVGIEAQANYYVENDSYYDAAEVLVLGKLGFAAEEFAVYATGGVGFMSYDDDSFPVYALGVGAEFKVSDDMSIRGDVLGMAYDSASAFDGVRASVGVLWHF
jgi:outer membrane immunogenic protein